MKNICISTVLSVILLTIALSSCNGPSNKINDPIKVTERYLNSKSWNERLLYVLDSSTVKPLIAKHYKNTDFSVPMKYSNIRKLIPDNLNSVVSDSIITIGVTILGTNAFGVEVSKEFVYYLVKTDEGFKIDWPGSIGYNPMPLNVYMSTRPMDVQIFRLYCSLSDYYNRGYYRSQDQYYSIECTNEDGYPRIYSYILKNSIDGQKLLEILKDGDYHRITLAIRYDKKSEGSSDVTTLYNLRSDSWYLKTDGKNQISNKMDHSEYFVNNLTGHIFLSDDIIYSLNFIEENEVIVSIYSQGDFQQPYTVKDSIIDIALWKTPLQYKILNERQLRLIAAPHLSGNEKGKIMEFRK